MTELGQIIDGKEVAAGVRERVRSGVAEMVEGGGRAPGLATVLVGDDPASQVYVRNKRQACEEAGMVGFHRELPADASQEEVAEAIEELNADDAVDGILLQLPLPEGLDQDPLIAAIDPAKDVDGLTPVNAGLLAQGRPGLVPCTPAGVMELLRASDTEVEGAEAVVIGRSVLVGRPMAAMLLNANASVAVCHSKTRYISAICRRADIIVAAVGVPCFLTGGMVRPGATVIDVGMNRTDDGLVGDVNFEQVRGRARALTPVPGGVGPMTIAMLLSNTLEAARGRSMAPA